MGMGQPRIAEIISIGDELNRGEIADTNAAWLGSCLLEQGILVRFRQGVNDHPQDIQKALLLSVSRSHLVFVTGGLGPTEDDVTVEAVASLLDVPVVYEPEHLRKWEQRHHHSALRSISLRQVRVPKGAVVLTNTQGAAPGFKVFLKEVPCFFFPGVPREMKPMFQSFVIPELEHMQEDAPHSIRRIYRIFGLSESEISQRLSGWIPDEDIRLGKVSLHYRLAFPEVLVIVIISQSRVYEVEAILKGLEYQLKERIGEYLYGFGEEGLPTVVGKKLLLKEETLATAESCTGGLLGGLITSVSGSSAYYLGGIIAYHNDIKQELLCVSKQLLQTYGAVSGPCVKEMATYIQKSRRATYGIAISGVAGPLGGTAEKPVGTVYIALATADSVNVKQFLWVGDREQIRLKAAYAGLDMLDRHLSPERV